VNQSACGHHDDTVSQHRKLVEIARVEHNTRSLTSRTPHSLMNEYGSIHVESLCGILENKQQRIVSQLSSKHEALLIPSG
jgi:hypothetical protein